MLIFTIIPQITSLYFPKSKTIDTLCYLSLKFDTDNSTHKILLTNSAKIMVNTFKNFLVKQFDDSFGKFKVYYDDTGLCYESFGYLISNLIVLVNGRFCIKRGMLNHMNHEDFIELVVLVLATFKDGSNYTTLCAFLSEVDKLLPDYYTLMSQDKVMIYLKSYLALLKEK